ncbi:Uncharacterised protein [Vibrio cholerae]|nr:Uncharacterised protein [Vibrio cholerae]CSI82934.1 Uncharacterised protein [Vibrio cholerae]
MKHFLQPSVINVVFCQCHRIRSCQMLCLCQIVR